MGTRGGPGGPGGVPGTLRVSPLPGPGAGEGKFQDFPSLESSGSFLIWDLGSGQSPPNPPRVHPDPGPTFPAGITGERRGGGGQPKPRIPGMAGTPGSGTPPGIPTWNSPPGWNPTRNPTGNPTWNLSPGGNPTQIPSWNLTWNCHRASPGAQEGSRDCE